MPRESGSIIGRDSAPLSIVERALASGSKTISYTYTEPTVYFEFAYDIARIANDKGLKNVFVTNGFMTEEALETISPYLHAANVDLKSFSDDFYRKRCGARLAPVLESLKKMKDLTSTDPGRYFIADQFANRHNPEIHYNQTASEICMTQTGR